jgi:hypothetical protein
VSEAHEVQPPPLLPEQVPLVGKQTVPVPSLTQLALLGQSASVLHGGAQTPLVVTGSATQSPPPQSTLPWQGEHMTFGAPVVPVVPVLPVVPPPVVAPQTQEPLEMSQVPGEQSELLLQKLKVSQ